MKLKRIMALVLCFAMVLSTMSFSVFAEDDTSYVAQIGDEKFETVLAALTAAKESTTATEVKLLQDSTELLATDFEFIVKSDVVITSETPVTVAFYNEGTTYDLIFGSENNNTIIIDSNVTLKVNDRNIWLGYYGDKNVTVKVYGTLSAGYQLWSGSDVEVYGTLESLGEALVLRRGKTLTVDGGKVDASYFSILAGNIDAKNDAVIECGPVWISNTGNYANEGNVEIALDNATLISSSNLKSTTTHEDGVSITIMNGSTASFLGNEHGESQLDENTNLVVSGNSTQLNIVSLTNNGTIEVTEGGKVSATGTVNNNGTIEVENEDDFEGAVSGNKPEIPAVIVANIDGTDYETLADALEATKEMSGDVVIDLLADAELSYGAREAYGKDDTTSITINGNNNTLTLNQTDSDWSSIGMKNANGIFKMNDVNVVKTGYGVPGGAWNTHAINFNVNTELTNVDFDNSIKVSGTSVLTDVNIVEDKEYYGIWIPADAESVTINGGSITATNGGRGIKIADQYVDAPAKVQLTVDGMSFETAKKAAVLVSSIGGADITATNYDISKVAADSQNFAWIDDGKNENNEKYTDYADQVKVNDEAAFVEGTVATINGVGYTNVATAFAQAVADDEVVIHAAGTYAVPTGKNIIITGAVDGVVFDNIGACGLYADVTFNNVTFDYYPNVDYTGLQHSGNLVYNDCTFNGQVFLYGTSETFNKCTFNQESSGAYNVWTYSAKKVTFNECTFNSAGKSVLIYHEGASTFNDVSVTDCDFIASAPVDGKAAIEMDSSLTVGINLVIDSETTATGFDKGSVSGNSLWNNKKGSKGANNDIVVTVGGVTVLEPKFEAKIGEVYYETIDDAIKVANAGDTVTILAGTYAVPSMKAGITIEGEGDVLLEGTIEGTLENLTLKNLHIKGSNAQRWAYAKGNLTFENVTFEATSVYALHFDGIAEGTNLHYKDCTIIGWAAMGGSPASCVFDGCTIKDNGRYGVIRTYFNTEIRNCTFDVDGANQTDVYQDGIHAVASTINVNNCENVNGDIKDILNASSSEEGDRAYIYVDDELALTSPLEVGVSTKAELDAAISNATAGDTIRLAADIDYGSDQLKIEKPIILDLGDFTLTTANNWGGMSLKNNPTIKNGNIKHNGNTAAIKAWNVAAFEDLTIEVAYTEGKTKGGIVIQSGTSVCVGSIKDVTIKGDGLTNGIETYNCGNATNDVIGSMENVIIDAVGTAMNISAPVGTATGCTFDGDVNGIEIWIKGDYSAKLDLVDCDVKGGVYAHDEFSSNPNIQNNGTLSLTTDANTTGASEGDITLTIARAEEVEGVLEAVMNNAKAKVGDTYYATLKAAITAAQPKDTITLLADVTEDVSIDKSITIDGGNFKYTGNISVSGTTSEVTVKNVNFENGTGYAITTNRIKSITVEDCTVNNYGYGFLYANKSTPTVVVKNVTVDGGNYGFHWVYGTSATLENVMMTDVTYGLYIQNYAGKNITLKNCDISSIGIWERSGSSGVQTFKFEGTNTVATLSASQYAKYVLTAVDATLTAPEGSDVTTDLEGYFVKNVDGTYNVAEKVAQIGDNYYSSLQEAVNAAQEGDTIVIRKDFDLNTKVTVENGKKITLDLNGKTITGTDTTSKNFSLIDNRGNLTITGDGTMTLTATVDSGWNRYSAVIANNPGGKLTIENGTIEHLGGTAMAYGIDNLTNGKGTYAETIINGGLIKSTYRGIRQFLNGVEAQNILTVNGGKVEGGNKGIWVQDPSAKANTGTITIEENASVIGGVYLSVTEGSTEWPVTVKIAKKAIDKLDTSNIPEAYTISLANGYYGVSAARSLNIASEKSELYAGDTVRIDVNIGGVNMTGATWTLNWNPDYFKPVDAEHLDNTGSVTDSAYNEDENNSVWTDGQVIKTYTFEAIAQDGVEVEGLFWITEPNATAHDEAFVGADIETTTNDPAKVKILLNDYSFVTKINGDEITETSKEVSFDGNEYKFVVEPVGLDSTVNYTITYKVNGEDKTEVSLKDEDTYVIEYKIDAQDGYADKTGTFTLTIKEADYKLEVTQYTDESDLVLIYTNTENLRFKYNGNLMIKVSDKRLDDAKYKLNGTDEYDYVYGYVAHTTVQGYDHSQHITYTGNREEVFAIDNVYLADINFTNSLNIQDIVTVFGVANDHPTLHANVRYQKQLLKADVNCSKNINGDDTGYVVTEVRSALNLR